MYAIVETGGKQYRVSPGDTFRIEKLPAERGTTVALDRVLMIGGDESMTVGTPLVENARVLCTVMEQDRAKKVMSIRYKAKKNVHTKRGHRQYYTCVRVDRIALGGEELVAAEEAVSTTDTSAAEIVTGAEAAEKE